MKPLNQVLEQLVRNNGFRAAVLTNELGLPLAAFPEGAESEAPAAMVARIQRLYDQVHERIGLRQMQEIVLRDEAGQQLICRRFCARQQSMTLAVLVPPGRAYRQAVEEAVGEIQTSWLAHVSPS